jgi:CBS domain-containing protein
MCAASIPLQQLACAPVGAGSQELVRPPPDELNLRRDLNEPLPFGRKNPWLGVTAEPAIGPAGECEAREQIHVELRQIPGDAHMVSGAEQRRTVLIPGAFPRTMVLLAKDIMEKTVLTVDEGTDALACARAMVQQHKGYAVLTRPPGTIAGIVTEWDYLSKVVAPGRDPATTGVREIATAVVDSCGPDTATDVVVATMAEKGIRRMVVRSGDQVLGIITARNVLRMFREYVDKVSSEIAGYQSNPTTLG